MDDEEKKLLTDISENLKVIRDVIEWNLLNPNSDQTLLELKSIRVPALQFLKFRIDLKDPHILLLLDKLSVSYNTNSLYYLWIDNEQISTWGFDISSIPGETKTFPYSIPVKSSIVIGIANGSMVDQIYNIMLSGRVRYNTFRKGLLLNPFTVRGG